VIIPARPGVFDVNACRNHPDLPFQPQLMRWWSTARRPRATASKAASSPSPARRCANSAHRYGAQITNRADLLMALGHGEGAREYYAEGRAASEIGRLWAATTFGQGDPRPGVASARCTSRRRRRPALLD